MSHGLGGLQREIKQILDRAFQQQHRPLRLAELRIVLAHQRGRPRDANSDRSLNRALKSLVDRGEVLICGGRGGQRDPYRYTTVESFASATGQQVKDTAHAQQIVAEMTLAGGQALDRLRGKPEE